MRWVFRDKLNSEGVLAKHKARLCARGDLQVTDLDTYASTLGARLFRFMCTFIAVFDLETKQIDAVNTFLNSKLPAPMCLQPPEGFRQQGKLLFLERAMYGLQESPLFWYNELTSTL